MQSICDTKVVIVSDGHAQMHKETKMYLRSLFCNKATEEDQFDELFASLDRYIKEKADADEDERIGTQNLFSFLFDLFVYLFFFCLTFFFGCFRHANSTTKITSPAADICYSTSQ